MIDSVAELLARLNEELCRAKDESSQDRIRITLQTITDVIETDGYTIQDYINQLDTRG